MPRRWSVRSKWRPPGIAGAPGRGVVERVAVCPVLGAKERSPRATASVPTASAGSRFAHLAAPGPVALPQP